MATVVCAGAASADACGRWAALGYPGLLEFELNGRLVHCPITSSTAARVAAEALRASPRTMSSMRLRALGALRMEQTAWPGGGVALFKLKARHLRRAATMSVLESYELLCGLQAGVAAAAIGAVRLELEGAFESLRNPAHWMQAAALQSFAALQFCERGGGPVSGHGCELIYKGHDVGVSTGAVAVADFEPSAAAARLAGVSVVVTGAAGGIGKDLCRLLAGRCEVVQTGRDISRRSTAWIPGAVERFDLDVTSDCDRAALARRLAKNPVILVNNAGYLPPQASRVALFAHCPAELEEARDRLLDALSVNALAPVLLQAALEERSMVSRVVQVSSIFGHFPTMRTVGSKAPFYSISKAVLNAMSQWLRHIGGTAPVVLVHPGWCRTATGGPDAPLLPAQGADTILRALLGPAQAGVLLQHPDQ